MAVVTAPEPLPAGWAYPEGAGRWHYFEEGMAESLCERYANEVAVRHRWIAGSAGAPTCAPCRRLAPLGSIQ